MSDRKVLVEDNTGRRFYVDIPDGYHYEFTSWSFRRVGTFIVTDGFSIVTMIPGVYSFQAVPE